MGYLSNLTDGVLPPEYTSTAAQALQVPDWYSEYVKGIAGKGVELAAQGQANPVPQQTIAGLNADQLNSFQDVRNNLRSWEPSMTAAQGAFSQVAPVAQQAQQQANSAVGGPTQNFTDSGTMSKYMSPYTSAVVNEIGRLGNQNFDENIMPKINATMISSGQYGSERNADVLGRAARDTQLGITGQQASAMESGYSTAGTLFNQDANRTQQQQATQAQTALAGGQLATGALTAAGQNTAQLGQTISGLGLADAQARQAIGTQQQQLTQQGYDADYNNQQGVNNAGWSNLNNLNSIVQGVQLPTSQTSTASGPLTRTATASPLTQLGGLYANLKAS